MELDRAAEDEELMLQDQNDTEDARRFILGSGAHAAIDVDSDAGTGMGMGSSSPTDPSTASAARGGGGSKKRSKAWDDFTEVTAIEKGKMVRIAAICNHCNQSLSVKSSSSIGHLLRHNCPAKKEKERTGRIQSILKYNPDGSLVCWEYSDVVARNVLCRLIARIDLPLCFAESDAFQEYIMNAHNPRFVKISRQTIARDLIKLFNERMEKLIETLKNSVSSIAITSDIWCGKAKEDYISVVAHFVNFHWRLEKRLLGLRPIEVVHTGRNIADRVATVVDDYDIADKIFSIVLDNASANRTAVSVLKPVFSKYIGHLIPPEDKEEDDLSAILLHQRCNVPEAWDDIYEDDVLPGRPTGTPVSVSSTAAAISELSS
ncbi:zinc finger BED domain-containing protein RICESLEEPER 2-like [Panicum hallii]|uniref:zinc finger BED domain-containing protein RICESLEEPER 2-like n=1 Tax=Panicum hallii TaxID=206008 RepID=UPI000DF4EE5E|nr:zinc finger BED domain-containing protein RICESLEEPER 2-like [Panicum hallii]